MSDYLLPESWDWSHAEDRDERAAPRCWELRAEGLTYAEIAAHLDLDVTEVVRLVQLEQVYRLRDQYGS